MNEFLVRFLIAGFSTALGAATTVTATHLWKIWQQRKGELTGEWMQSVVNDNGKVEKRDHVTLKHNHLTKRVEGSIERLAPEDQKFKKWVFEGVLRGNVLFIIFWTADVKSNPGSYGTIQLHEIDEGKLTGFYIRPPDY